MAATTPIEKIISLYKDDKMPVSEIAEKLGVSREAIYQRLRRAGINPKRRRYKTKHSRSAEELSDLYVNHNLTLVQVGERLGLSGSGVGYQMKRLGIPRRRGADHLRKYPKLNALAIGDSIVIDIPKGVRISSSFYEQAKKLGIRILVRRINEDQIMLTRTKQRRSSQSRRP